MKYHLCIFLFVLSVGFIESQTKKLDFSIYQLEYPKSWRMHKFNGFVMFRPKNTRKTRYMGPNPVHVFPNTINNRKESTLENIEALKTHQERIHNLILHQ